MRRMLITICLLLLSGFAIAQESIGIQFQQGLNWAQIKEKALKENKYIFVDGFTTWCGPCKQMAQEIFPQQKVGAFFNQNFINVAVQFDVTKKDNPEVKNWYKEVKVFEKEYQVVLYPTYLFFNPNGELVHRINGATFSADEFITKAKKALDPSTQYAMLRQQFQKGNREPNFLFTLTKAAQQTNDFKFIPIVANAYLNTQKNLLTNENIRLIGTATLKSTDPGFKVLREHGQLVDSVLGKGKSTFLLKTIAFDEVLLPYLNVGGKKTEYGAGMTVYEGKPRANVDWEEAQKKLLPTYEDLADEIILEAKPFYYREQQNWPKFTEAVSAYVYQRSNAINMDKVDSYANDIFIFRDDPTCINAAIGWSNKIFLEAKNENTQSYLQYLFTLGNLLYKSGKKEPGIANLEEVLSKVGGKDERLIKTIAKMKNREKTW
jgi:thioredoxin-related protein